MPAALAAELATRSEQIAASLDASDPCRARAEAEALRQRAIAAVNARRVPPRYQEELTSSVNALVSSIACTPPPAGDGEEDDDEGKDEGKGKGKGKHGGEHDD